MGLYEEYFQLVIEEERVEVRLNDEKRRKIRVGDTIEFVSVPQERAVGRPGDRHPNIFKVSGNV